MDSEIRSSFLGLGESTYLNTANMGPYPMPVVRAAQEFLESRRRTGPGSQSLEPIFEAAQHARTAVAEFINAKPSEIAFTTNTSEGPNIVASCMDWCEGDNIVWDDMEFPSQRIIWLHLEGTRGVESRVAKSSGGAVSVADYERLVDERTRLISVTDVSFINGYRYDLKGLADLAHSHGAYLHVDAIQSVGSIKVDVTESGVDFLSCGLYKWLLGPSGLAFFYIREELLPEFEPPHHGWKQIVGPWDKDPRTYEFHQSARKFETASQNAQGFFELNAALDFVNGIGMGRIEPQVLRLSSKLYQGLASMDFKLMTPPQTQSGIVTCLVEDGEKMGEFLRGKRIVATVRGNQVRFSPHFFNTEEEIEFVLQALASTLSG